MTLAFILDVTLRTATIAALAGLGLALFRVRSSTLKLAVWRLVLYASLLMPLVALLPKRTVVVPPAPVVRTIEMATTRFVIPQGTRSTSTPIDWPTIAWRAYALMTGLLLLRALSGLLRLREFGAHAIPVPEAGPEVYETANLAVPVTYGIVKPRILLPADWRQWPGETLDAVLAHERSHIAERDFLTQCLAKVNRALYWANPLAWWLDRELAQLAEQAGDDAALNRITERPDYAAVLLSFAGRRSNLASAGVAMARTGGISRRVDRILDEARLLAQPLTPLSRVFLFVVAFAVLITVGACKMATVSAQTTGPKPPASVQTDAWWINGNNGQEWVLVTPQGTSMNGGSGTMARAKSHTPNASGGDYLWFTRDGKEYLIDDAKTIAEIRAWFKPMEELGRQQGELGERQGELGKEMGKLGEEMAKLGEQMSHVKVEMPDMKKLRAEVERLNKLASGSEASVDEVQRVVGELQARLGDAQARAGEKQAKIGELQAKLGGQQAALGEKQGKLGELQGKLGEQQGKIAQEAEEKLRRLMQQAIQDGRAKSVR